MKKKIFKKQRKDNPILTEPVSFELSFIRIFNKLKKDSGLCLGVISVIASFLLISFNFYDFLQKKAFFVYYNIDIKLLDSSPLFLLLTITIILLIVIIICILINNIKNKSSHFSMKRIRTIIYCVLGLLLSIFFFFLYFYNFNASLSFNLLISAILFLWLFCPIYKWLFKTTKIGSWVICFLKQGIVLCIFLFFTLYPVLIYSFELVHIIFLKKEYQLINNQTVIVYTEPDRYFIADSEIKEDKIIIYKSTIRPISTEGIITKKKQFNKIITKE